MAALSPSSRLCSSSPQELAARGVGATAPHDRGLREEVALEEIEAEVAAEFALLARVDLFGQQPDPGGGAGLAHQQLERLRRGAEHVDLDDFDERQQRRVHGVELHDVVEREREAPLLQRPNPLRDLRGDLDGLEDLDDGALGRQQLHHVRHQKLGIEVDEPAPVAQNGGDAELAEGVADDARGRHAVVRHRGGVPAAGAEQQLECDGRRAAVEDGLTA
jgi:hypothetical protein